MKINVYIYTKHNIGVLEISAHILGDTDAPYLEAQVKDLIAKGIKNFILDLAAVRLINSIGIGTMMACMTSVKRAEGVLKLSTVSEKISDIMTLMGIDQLFEIYEDREDAVASYDADS
jgi:anti-sigma B factor antagonist